MLSYLGSFLLTVSVVLVCPREVGFHSWYKGKVEILDAEYER